MLKILIAEDEELIRKGIVLTVDWASLGCIVTAEAANGAEALEMMDQHKPDLIITDLKMPVMDGIEALKAIREYDPSAKVVMLTAAGQQSKIVEAVKSGAAEFITKPFEKEEVIRTLGEITK